MSIRYPTVAEIKDYRIREECSLTEARRRLTAEAILTAATRATTIGDLRQVIIAHLTEARDAAGI